MGSEEVPEKASMLRNCVELRCKIIKSCYSSNQLKCALKFLQ